MIRKFFALLLLGAATSLAACGGVQTEAKYPSGAPRSTTGDDIYAKPKSIFGEGGISAFDSKKSSSTDVITVNAYLWRAALDTVSFMPLATVDPFGGVILTDWYSDPDKPGERYKLNVFVMTSQLRSDGIRVTMFKQRNNRDVAVPQADNVAIENAILNRARELRVAGALNEK